MIDNIETMRPAIAGAVGNPANTCARSCEGNAYQIEIRRLTKERDALAAKMAELEGQEPVAYGVMKRGERVWYVCDSKSTAQGYANHYAHRDARGSDQNVVPVYCRPIPAEPVNARLLEFAQEWLARQGADENYMTAKARAAIAAAEAQGVTEPKRLTDEQIDIIKAGHNTKFYAGEVKDHREFARAIEAAVLGVQEAKNGD